PVETLLYPVISGNSEVVILAYTPPESGPPGTRTQTEQILSLPPLPIGLEGRAVGCRVTTPHHECTTGRARPSWAQPSSTHPCPSPRQQPPQRQPPPWKARGHRPGRTPGTSRHRCAGRPS